MGPSVHTLRWVEWVDNLDRLVGYGEWASYATISEVVYGHPRSARTVGTVLRKTARKDCAHRILPQHGVVSPHWVGVDTHGLGTGPEECIARLQDEGSWTSRMRELEPNANWTSTRSVDAGWR